MLTTERNLIFGAAFLRSLATGFGGVALGMYLSQQFPMSQIGIVVSAGLAGATLWSIATTWFADRIGRRRLLVLVSLLSAIGGIAFSFAEGLSWLLIASFVGMLNGMGRDRGALLILETAMLPQTTSDANRTWVFAWYTFLHDLAIALGGLAVGLADIMSFQSLFVAYSIAFFLCALLYSALPTQIESSSIAMKVKLSQEGRSAITKLSLLFFLDAIAGGFLVTALLSEFFRDHFSVSIAVVGTLFFLARGLNALSHFGAAWLSKRIGLVNTMVFTHAPSSIILMTVVVVPNFWIAAILFLLREAFVEMDVPTRTSYVMAIVKPEERIFASGITNIVRMGGWAIAPAFGGLFMAHLSPGTPIFIGAGLKIAYDIILYFSFRHIKAPEEET